MNILIGPLRFVPFAADIPVSLLVAVHFEQRVERLEVGGEDRKSTRLNSSHSGESRMPSSA